MSRKKKGNFFVSAYEICPYTPTSLAIKHIHEVGVRRIPVQEDKSF